MKADACVLVQEGAPALNSGRCSSSLVDAEQATCLLRFVQPGNEPSDASPLLHAVWKAGVMVSRSSEHWAASIMLADWQRISLGLHLQSNHGGWAGCLRVAAEQLERVLIFPSTPVAMDSSLAPALTSTSLTQGQSSSDLLQVLFGLGSQAGASSILALALPVAHVLLGFLGPLIMYIMDRPPGMFRLPCTSTSAQARTHGRSSDPQADSDWPADPHRHSHGEDPTPQLPNGIADSLFTSIMD